MHDVVFASAARLPVGRFLGSMQRVNTVLMGEAVARAALRRAAVEPDAVDAVLMSETYRGDLPGCSARPVGLRAGLPVEVPGFNLNMHCGSGLQAIVVGSQMIRCGDAATVLVVAMESMSRAAYLLRGAREGFRLGHAKVVDQLVQKGDPAKDPRLDPTARLSMGETAEHLADKHRISRQRQDELAVRSQRNAGQAIEAGRFSEQIVPIEVPEGKRDHRIFDTDEHPRPDTSLDKLARLRPIFREGGTVTAGNSSGMNDGAAALVLMSSKRAGEVGVEPLGRLLGHAAAGVDPDQMGLGPVPATRAFLARTGLALESFSTIELNEAFAAQVLACFAEYPELGEQIDRINVNGSGISLGHPIGATGAILAVKALYELKRIGGGKGLCTMCIGGGQGIALGVEV